MKNKLKIKNSSEGVVATLYNTDIVRIVATNRQVILNSGGWKTNVTKTSINRVLSGYNIPLSVFKHQNEWRIALQNGNILPFEDEKMYQY